MWGSYGIHTIMIRDKDYSLQTCQQFIFVNQASCYMKKDTYEHTGETTCAVNVEKKPFCEVYPTSEISLHLDNFNIISLII